MNWIIDLSEKNLIKKLFYFYVKFNLIQIIQFINYLKSHIKIVSAFVKLLKFLKIV
jgi:hypothetical protein